MQIISTRQKKFQQSIPDMFQTEYSKHSMQQHSMCLFYVYAAIFKLLFHNFWKLKETTYPDMKDD